MELPWNVQGPGFSIGNNPGKWWSLLCFRKTVMWFLDVGWKCELHNGFPSKEKRQLSPFIQYIIHRFLSLSRCFKYEFLVVTKFAQPSLNVSSRIFKCCIIKNTCISIEKSSSYLQKSALVFFALIARLKTRLSTILLLIWTAGSQSLAMISIWLWKLLVRLKRLLIWLLMGDLYDPI